MSKSWKEPSKGTFGKGKGFDKRKDIARKNDAKARLEIQQIMRRSGEKVETFFD